MCQVAKNQKKSEKMNDICYSNSILTNLYSLGVNRVMGKYFGTDGFRGEANVNLTVEHAFKVGRFLGHYFGKDHKARVVIGKDTRRSSYMFEYALAAGQRTADTPARRGEIIRQTLRLS